MFLVFKVSSYKIQGFIKVMFTRMKLCLFLSLLVLKHASIVDMTKTRNGLESGLVHGLNRILWIASYITVLLF